MAAPCTWQIPEQARAGWAIARVDRLDALKMRHVDPCPFDPFWAGLWQTSQHGEDSEVFILCDLAAPRVLDLYIDCTGTVSTLKAGPGSAHYQRPRLRGRVWGTSEQQNWRCTRRSVTQQPLTRWLGAAPIGSGVRTARWTRWRTMELISAVAWASRRRLSVPGLRRACPCERPVVWGAPGRAGSESAPGLR